MLFVLLACQNDPIPEKNTGTNVDTDDTQHSTVDSGLEEDSAIEDSAYGHTDPWPEEDASWENILSVVHDGKFISLQDSIPLHTAPAGIDSSSTLQIIITNRSDEELSFASEPDSWLVGEGFSWISPPPTTLMPEQTSILELEFNPILETQETRRQIPLYFPISNENLSVNIDVSVPAPLRMVFVGDNGYTLISDDYGQNISEEYIPSSSGVSMLDIEWGEDVFFRASTTKSLYSNEGVIYEYSADGLSWQESLVADVGAPFDCEYGLGFSAFEAGEQVFFYSVMALSSCILHSICHWLFYQQAVYTGEHFAVSVAGPSSHRLYPRVLDPATALQMKTLESYTISPWEWTIDSRRG